jgi:hypothetical protein
MLRLKENKHDNRLRLINRLSTVEVMNMSRYRYRPVTSPLPFWALRYRPLPFLDQRYPTLLNVTPTLPTVTNRY